MPKNTVASRVSFTPLRSEMVPFCRSVKLIETRVTPINTSTIAGTCTAESD